VAEPLLGLIGEFGTADALLAAARQAKSDGFQRIDAFSPYPIEGMADVLALKHDHRIGWITSPAACSAFLGCWRSSCS